MARPTVDPDFEALVTFLSPEAGGKNIPVRPGYRPQHLASEDLSTSGHHEYINIDQVQPGQSAMAHIWLLSPEIFSNALWPGRNVETLEGSKLVAHARVQRIFNEELRAEA